MDIQESNSEIKKLCDTAKNIFIFIPQNATFDATAAALALYLSLRSAGKNVLIGSPSQMQVEFSRLVGIDKVTDKIGNRNLIIAFDYKEESIEKVSYNVEGNKFNLVIQPRSGFPPLSQENVNFSYEGMEAEMIFVIGATKLETLGSLYEKDHQAFSDSTIVNIDRSPANSKFGQINLIDPKAASISELVYLLIKNLALTINADIAGNLLKGIEAQTQNFQTPFADVQTFEIAAELMKAGAKRSLPTSPSRMDWSQSEPTPFPSFRRPMTSPQAPFLPYSPSSGYPTAPTNIQSSNLDQAAFQPQRPSAVTPPQVTAQPRDLTVPRSTQGQVKYDQHKSRPRGDKHYIRSANQSLTGNQNIQDQNQIQPQSDWLKPKIFKGKTEV